MDSANVKQLIQLNTRYKREVKAKAAAKIAAADENLSLVLAQWAEDEFTEDTFFNEGVLEKFAPYWLNPKNDTPVTFRAVDHVHKVVRKKLGRYTKLYGNNSLSRFDTPLLAEPIVTVDFYEQLTSRVPYQKDEIVLFTTVSPELLRPKRGFSYGEDWSLRRRNDGDGNQIFVITPPWDFVNRRSSDKVIKLTFKDAVDYITENR